MGAKAAISRREWGLIDEEIYRRFHISDLAYKHYTWTTEIQSYVSRFNTVFYKSSEVIELFDMTVLFVMPQD